MRFIPYCSGSGNWISFVQSGSKRSRKTRWHAVINAGACRGGKQRRLIIRVWGGGMTGGGQGMVECKSVGRRVEDVGVEGWSLRGSKGPSLPFGEEGEREGLMTLITGGRNGRLSSPSSSAWISKKKVRIAADRRVRPPENAMLFRPCTEIERDYPVSLHPLLVAV